MFERRPGTTWFWERGTDGAGHWTSYTGTPYRPAGEDLAALRRGTGREAGTVPEMWPFYVAAVADGDLAAASRSDRVPRALEAEHHTLTLFGLHQQSQASPMHVRGIGVGDAILALRESARFSEGAVDRRFSQAATATSLTELVHHLRGLVSQLRDRQRPLPLDYTRLAEDLAGWSRPQLQQRVRRRWGGQYHRWSQVAREPAAGGTSAGS